jgi:hypothetical protein
MNSESTPKTTPVSLPTTARMVFVTQLLTNPALPIDTTYILNPRDGETSDALRIVTLSGIIDEEQDSEARWFIFCEADCAWPTHYIVRATTWEQAWEDFVEACVESMHTDEVPEEYDGERKRDGSPVNTENVMGREARLVEVTL